MFQFAYMYGKNAIFLILISTHDVYLVYPRGPKTIQPTSRRIALRVPSKIKKIGRNIIRIYLYLHICEKNR